MNIHIPPSYDVDLAAKNIAHMARLAKQMPPAWDGGQIAHYAGMPDGSQIGLMLPGRGLKLACDLKNLGIVKSLPFVYEDSPTRRLLDLVRDERGAITTYDGIIAARCGTNWQDLTYFKPTLTTTAAAWSSLAQVASGLPHAMTYTNIPGGAVHTNTNVGAWSLGMSDPGGSNKKYLLTLGWMSTGQINMLMLVDLLVAAGNILATTNTAQTVNSTALTRYTTGAGVLATMHVTTAIGTTASNISLSSYTNQAGTAARANTAVAMTTSAIVGRLLPVTTGAMMNFQSGDYGIRSVETITLSAAMSAGVMALNLYYPLAFCPGIGANIYTERDSTIQIDGITEIANASQVLGCLNVYCLPNSSSTGIFNMFLRTCEG